MLTYCYADGKIKKLKDAKVAANDLSVLRGYGVFDFARVYNGHPFHLKDHFARFRNSARDLGLKITVKYEEVEKAVEALLRKNKITEASVRLVLTGGATADGISPGRPEFFILMDSLTDYAPAVFAKGAKLITAEHERPLAEAKHTNYALAVRLQAKRKKAGAIEILYVHNGQVLECAMSNFGLFKGNTLITPKEGVLLGVTRKVILKLAKGKFKIEERRVKLGELATADEAFIMATNKYVVPIVQIDKIKVGKGKPGENTKWLLAEYKKYLKQECYK